MATSTIQRVFEKGQLRQGSFVFYRGQVRRVESVRGDDLNVFDLDDGSEITFNEGDRYDVPQPDMSDHVPENPSEPA